MYTTTDAARSKLSGGNLGGNADGRLLVDGKPLHASNRENITVIYNMFSHFNNNITAVA